MNNLPFFLLLLMPGLIGAVTVALLAPKLNRRRRERRTAAMSDTTIDRAGLP